MEDGITNGYICENLLFNHCLKGQALSNHYAMY